MGFQLKRAQRTVQKARIAISGPSGSGKTKSALRLARGLVEAEEPGAVSPDVSDDGIRIVVLDTEQRSSELYSDVVPFAPYHLAAPYSPERYMQALDEIERVQPLVIIVDQGSHAWAGKGGLLETLEKLKENTRNGNEFAAWGKITPKQTTFVERLLECKCHLIVTLRSKTEYVLEERERNGRKVSVPKKVGMAPIQRDGFEYEFMTMFEVDREKHLATVSKDRTELYPEEPFLIDESWGHKLHAWLTSAPAPEMPQTAEPQPAEEKRERSTKGQRGKSAERELEAIAALFIAHGLSGKDPEVQERKLEILRQHFGTRLWSEVAEMSVETLKEGRRALDTYFAQQTHPGDESVPFGDDESSAMGDPREE